MIKYLKDNKYIGKELSLKCTNHDVIAKIQSVEDFAKVPEGGCSKICDVRLDCGHRCERSCHPYAKTEMDPTGHYDVKC